MRRALPIAARKRRSLRSLSLEAVQLMAQNDDLHLQTLERLQAMSDVSQQKVHEPRDRCRSWHDPVSPRKAPLIELSEGAGELPRTTDFVITDVVRR